MTPAEKPTPFAEILCGAYELALLTAHWQSDSAARKKSGRQLYAVDVDILNFYSNPQDNSQYAAIVGLMPEDHPEAHQASILGIAEMLGRYFFRPEDLPSVLLDSNLEEFGSIYEIVTNKYLQELSTTAAQLPHAETTLRRVVSEYLGAKNRTARDFVAEVAKRLKDMLPALYEPYNATREISRWAPLIDIDNPRVIPATGVNEFRQALDSRFDSTCRPQGLSWPQILNAWQKAIALTSLPYPTDADQKKRETDISAMAELEWINRFLFHTHQGARLMYVTGAPRLFRAALIRFQVVRDPGSKSPQFGSRRQLAIGLYLALVKPQAELGRLDVIDPNWAPLRDVRSFMVDPGFVEFSDRPISSSGHGEHSMSPTVEADLTKWLNLFLSGTRDQHKSASRGYLRLHGFLGVHTLLDKGLGVADFLPEAYETLIENWRTFSMRVAAAHGIERGVRRRVITDIGKVFQGQSAVSVLSETIDQEMADVLQNVGRATLFQETLTEDAHGTPPLIFGRFPEVEKIIYEVISARGRKSNLDVGLGEIEAIILALDHSKAHKNYLNLLGKAILFASTGSWGACLAFASQAFAAAKMSPPPEMISSEDPVTGREAAYLCHYAARKRVAPIRWLKDECEKWSNAWQTALRIEKTHSAFTNQPNVLRFHQLRYLVESDALSLTESFYRGFEQKLNNVDLRSLSPTNPEATMDGALLDISQIIKIAVADSEKFGFLVAALFVERQLIINQIQRILVLHTDLNEGDRSALTSYLDQYEGSLELHDRKGKKLLPPSGFDMFIISSARAALLLTTRWVSNTPLLVMPYDKWKFERLNRFRDIQGDRTP